jgi:hypothetical protein
MDADPKNTDDYFLLLVCRERNEAAPEVPLLVKIAPDLTEEDMQDIARVLTSPDTRYMYLLLYVNFLLLGHRTRFWQVTPSHLTSASVPSTFTFFGNSHQKGGMGRAAQGHLAGECSRLSASIWIDDTVRTLSRIQNKSV